MSKTVRRKLGAVDIELIDEGGGPYLAIVFRRPTGGVHPETTRFSDFLPKGVSQEAVASFVADEVREHLEMILTAPGSTRTFVINALDTAGHFETVDDRDAYTKSWLETWGRLRWALKMDRGDEPVEYEIQAVDYAKRLAETEGAEQ